MAFANALEIDWHNKSILSDSSQCLRSVVVSLQTLVLKVTGSTPATVSRFLPFFLKNSNFLHFLTVRIFVCGFS